MASFTDIIPQFNPYVQQLPVEAMVQVGMAKQQMYEQNVTKIQSEIDRIAGLDVIRDVDKKYLQSKLDQLHGKLTLLAGSDFSNFQIANTVGGMSKQITNDKFVQNAVSSTARYRKEVAKAEALKKEGKWSINRQFDFNNEVNSWLNDTKLETTFNGEFKEHRDVNKKVLEVIAKLHPNANTKDFPYVINPDGSIDYRRYAAIMQRQGIKAVDEGQIKTAVNAVLDSDDYDELYSQGRYNYRGYDVTDLQRSATNSYRASRLAYETKLDQLRRQKLVTTNLEQQEQLNESIKYYEGLLGDDKSPGALDIEYKSALESIQADPNKARATLYTRNWLDQIANGFAYREVTDEVLSNPGRADYWKLKEYEFNQIKEANDQYWKKMNYAIDLRTLQIAESKEAREAAKEAGVYPYFAGSGDKTTDDLESLKNYTTYTSNLSKENNAILADIANRKSTLKTKVLPEDILPKIEEYKNGKYVPSSDYEKQQFDKYIQNSNSVKQQTDLYQMYENAAYEKTIGKEKLAAINQELSKRGDLIIGGQRFSAKEVYNYLSKEQVTRSSGTQGLAVLPVGTAVGARQPSVTTYSINDDLLTDREKVIKRALSERYKKVGGVTGNANIDKYIGGFSPLVDRNKVVKADVLKEVAKNMSGVTGIFKTEQAAVVFKDANEKQRLIDNLVNIAGADINIKVAGENYTPASLIESMKTKNENDIAIQLRRQGNEYFIQVVDKKDPKNVQRMPVPAQFVASNPSLGQKYLSQGTDLALSLLANNGSTNIYNNYENAYYHNGFFGRYDNYGRKTVTLPVSADLRNEGGSLYPTFRLKTKNGEVELPYKNATDYSTFQSVYLPSLTDDKIISLFKIKYPNIEQLIAR